MSMFLIYGLYEAGKPEEIQYIGCTRQPLAVRLAAHRTGADYATRTRNSTLLIHVWVTESAANGVVIEGRILQQTKNKLDALDLEWNWIVRYERQGTRLLNLRRNSRAAFRDSPSPQPDAPNFGNEAVKNFLQYLRALPM